MICFIVTVAYCAIGGFWSVVVTDFIQFIIAMGGAIFLAYLAVSHFGGLSDLMETAKAGFGEGRAEAMTTLMPLKNAAEIEATKLVDPGLFALDPSVNFALTDFWQWLVYVMVFWYAVGFTDGGSYFAQRMLSAKTEQDAKLGYMWFGIMHYCVRMWPWLLVGLAGACLFPTLSHHQALNPSATAYDPEMNYIYAMRVFLMPGLLGIIVASFLAAYMSTISTQVNLAASYLVSDFYRPFIVKGAAEKHYVGVATVTTVVIAFIGIIVTLFMSSIAGAWFLLSSLNAGIGLVYILRWYWWRISAWSEISCFATLLILTALMQCFVYGDNWRLVGEKIDSNQKVLAMIEADPETYAETAEDIEQLDPNYYANSVSGIPVFYLRWLEGDGIITRINGIDLDSTRQYTVRGKIPAELLKADNELTDEQATRLERLRDETTLAEIDSGITVPDDEYAVVQTLNESWGTFPYKIIPLVFGSLFVWVLVTFITAPVDEEKLKAFYRKVRPGGPGWTRIAALCPEIPEKDNKIGARPFLGWATAVLAIYSALFGIAQLLLGSWGWAIGLLAITTIAGVALWNLLKQKD